MWESSIKNSSKKTRWHCCCRMKSDVSSWSHTRRIREIDHYAQSWRFKLENSFSNTQRIRKRQQQEKRDIRSKFIMTLYYDALMIISHSAANLEIATLTKVKKNDKETILYHIKKLKKTLLFQFMNEEEQTLALKQKKKRVKKMKWRQELSDNSSKFDINAINLFRSEKWISNERHQIEKLVRQFKTREKKKIFEYTQKRIMKWLRDISSENTID